MSVILRNPVITEKTTRLTEKLNQYVFIVHKSANKIQIKDAVEKMYGVQVENVATLIRAAKSKTRFTRSGMMKGKSVVQKRAIVTLKEGEVIDFYSNI